MRTGDTTRELIDSVAGRTPKSTLVVRWVEDGTTASVDPISSRAILGRGDECDIRLVADGVSRRHAEIYRQGPLHVIRDLASKNGTFLNGARVAHAPVAATDVLRIGVKVGVLANVEPSELYTLFDEIAPGVWGGAELAFALHAAARAADSDLPVSLVGATGVGKEVVARAVHGWSRRRGEFHAINCAALPVTIAESELFGYLRGAFTGADRDGVGHLRAADKGTLFLDEIAELPLALQAKFLRVLEEGRVTPLGGTKAVPVDVRFVAAFQRDPTEMVRAGTFREDLAARLAGLVVELPPLRARRSDISLLFQRFVRLHSGGRAPSVDPKLVEALCLYDWPRNVRELELVSRQMLSLHGHEPALQRAHLPRNLTAPARLAPSAIDDADIDPANRKEYDLYRLVAALRDTDGNVKLAAQKLGFSRQRAYRLMDGRTPQALLAEEPIAGREDGSEG